MPLANANAGTNMEERPGRREGADLLSIAHLCREYFVEPERSIKRNAEKSADRVAGEKVEATKVLRGARACCSG